MLVVESFLIGLAANLAFALMQAGSARLKQALLGTPQEQALQRAYQAAFEAALRASAPAGDEASTRRVADHLQRFLALPDVANTLLDMALVGALAPDLDLLGQRYASIATDGDVPPIDINRILVAFHGRLTTALVDEASAEDSPLYNQVSLARIQTIHALLRGQQHSLRQVSHLLQRLEAQPGVYNIIIEQATGVAIGDGATVNQFPDDVRLVLAEVLATVRQLNAQRRPPAYSQDDLRSYLETVIERCQMLDLQSTGGPVDRLPLERVYAALKADASNAAERRANHQQFLADLATHEQELALTDLDEHARYQIKRAVARGLDPMGLTLALRNRANAERGDYLALAARRIDLGELIAQERWAVLLGDPGAGKTTLIRWLAMRFARAMLAGEVTVQAPADQVRADADEQTAQQWSDLGPTRLPVPLRLADYAAERWQEGRPDTGLALFDFLGKQPWLGRRLHPDPVVGQAIAQDAIRQGRALILLDGLDEIADQFRRSQVVDAIAVFLRVCVRDPISGLCAAEEGYAPWQQRPEERPQAQGGNQVLITSRPIGYYLAPLPSTLAHYTVEEMGEPAIIRFCQAWATAVHEQTGQGDPTADAEALRQTVLDPGRPALREIAANPLLLTILAGLFYTLKGKLPERRVELYDKVVEAFARQRHDAWLAQGLSDERFRYAMGYVASRLHASPDPRFANGLAGDMDVKAWLRQALRTYDGKSTPAQREQAALLFASAAGLGGFLLERGDGAYGFIHRTFQEYFVALYLAYDPNQVAAEVCQRLDDPGWREPLLLTVALTALQDWDALPGLLSAILGAPEPAPGLLPRNALFLAACLREMKDPPPVDLVAAAVQQLIAVYADRAWPADETTQPPQALRQAIERALRPLGEVVGAQRAVAAALTGEDPSRRMAAAELILAIEWRCPALIPPLLAAARDHDEPVAVVREALWQQVQAHPEALASQPLPLRSLLADPAQAQRLAQRPDWLAMLQALYLRPDWTDDQALGPDVVCFDSQLSPWLIRAWQEDWSREYLLDQLTLLAEQDPDSALALDAAWAVALLDDRGWRRLLAIAGNGAVVRRPIAGLGWNTRAYAYARDLDLSLALDLDRALALALDLDRALALALDLDRDCDLATVQALVLTSDLALTLFRAYEGLLDIVAFGIIRLGSASPVPLDVRQAGYYAQARALDLVRALTPDLTRALALARDLALDHRDRDLLVYALVHVRNYPTFRADLDAIEGCVARSRKLLDGRAEASDILVALDSATIQLNALRAVLQVPAWRALASARAVLDPLRPAVSQGSGRLVWRAELLHDAATFSFDFLARLHVPQPQDTEAENDMSTARQELIELAETWLSSDDCLRRRYAALLLAEMGEITAASLPELLSLLTVDDDLLRCRARHVLNQERRASRYGSDTLLALASCVVDRGGIPLLVDLPTDSAILIFNYCVWTLTSVIHDRVDWLRTWASQLDEVPSGPLAIILGSIGRLDVLCWPEFLDMLRTAGPRTQKALLQSAGLLLSADKVPEDKRPALADALLALTQSPIDGVVQAAMLALGRFYQPPAAVAQTLLLSAEQGLLSMADVLTVLACFNRPDRETWEEVDRLLSAPPLTPEVDAALVRWLVNQRKWPRAMALLAARRPDSAVQLRSLLTAGANDEDWGTIHEHIVLIIRELMQQHADLWQLLVEELRSALAAGSWRHHRIALAALARCAEAMPQQFNRSAADLMPLLLRATKDVKSSNSRRFAITALSYLRVITPDVLAALLRLTGDTAAVQKDALAATARFNQMDRSLSEALPDELIAALTGPSVLRARTAARLLQALGTSQAAQAAPGLRRQIVQALAAALQDPGSRRLVWTSAENTDGTLDQDLYTALLRVAGF